VIGAGVPPLRTSPGSMLNLLSNFKTVSVGCAPRRNQSTALSWLIVMVAGFVNGL
jgi:hypothetical protein